MDRKAYVERHTGCYTHMRTPDEHYVVEFGLPKIRPKLFVYFHELVKTVLKVVTIDRGRKNTRDWICLKIISVFQKTSIRRSNVPQSEQCCGSKRSNWLWRTLFQYCYHGRTIL